MKKLLALVAAGFALLLSGCANMSHFGVADDRVEVVDYRKIQVIDEHARRSGLTVIWMRQPTKLVDRVAVVN